MLSQFSQESSLEHKTNLYFLLHKFLVLRVFDIIIIIIIIIIIVPTFWKEVATSFPVCCAIRC